MIFSALELENFGIYAGRQRLELATEKDRPVVLVGGTNGAGKTTLLEAFTLCLHGRRALGARVSQDAYDSHIRSRFHVVANGQIARESAITLEFDHVHSGRRSDYSVMRRWEQLDSGVIKESMKLEVDGVEIDDLNDSSRQDFLDSLLPPGLAGFFLFDGEQIQDLADDENGEHLAEAVKRLLGLDLVDQLQADLRRFVGRANAGDDNEDLLKALAASEKAVAAAQEQVALSKETAAILEAEQDQLDARLNRARDKIAREGGALASERDKLEKGARKAAVESAAADEQMRALVAGLLPFAIAQKLAGQVAERLESEQAAEEDEIIVRRVQAAAKALRKEFNAPSAKAVTKTVQELLGVDAASSGARVHEISAADRAVMVSQLESIRDGIRTSSKQLAKRMARAHDKCDRNERKLGEIPDDEALAPLIEALQKIEHERGELSSEKVRLAEETKQAEHELKTAEREKRKVEERAAKAGKGSSAAELALRTVGLLEAYGVRAERRRLERIELQAARYFNRLSRKGELLSGITIDPDTFMVRVIRWDQSELEKDRLSAGEKQLLAIALLWALAQASQRPLPVVVDTPLARLDKEHRRRILSEYLPNVSHQVVVLSTDTEVDLAAAAKLSDVTSRRIFLSHDTGRARTEVEEGYFSSGEEQEAATGAR